MHQFAHIQCFGIREVFVVNSVEEFQHFVSNEVTQIELEWKSDTLLFSDVIRERHLAYDRCWSTSGHTSHSYHIFRVRRFTDRRWRIYVEIRGYFLKVIVIIILDHFHLLCEKFEHKYKYTIRLHFDL